MLRVLVALLLVAVVHAAPSRSRGPSVPLFSSGRSKTPTDTEATPEEGEPVDDMGPGPEMPPASPAARPEPHEPAMERHRRQFPVPPTTDVSRHRDSDEHRLDEVVPLEIPAGSDLHSTVQWLRPPYLALLVLAPQCEHAEAARTAFEEAVATAALQHWELHSEDRPFTYATLDLGRYPEAADELRLVHPHRDWACPEVLVSTHHGAFDRSARAFPHIVGYRHGHFAADVLFALQRVFQPSGVFNTKKALWAALDDKASDGVVVALMADAAQLDAEDEQALVAWRRVVRDESPHLHFMHAVGASAELGELNPDAAHVAAFVLDDGEVDVEYFKFPRGAPAFRMLQSLRSFVDHAKLRRHPAGGRRYRGLTRRLHYHRSGVADCAPQPALVRALGIDTATGAVFLNWTEPRPLGSVLEGRGLPHDVAAAVASWCPPSKHELFVPAARNIRGGHYVVELYTP